MKHEGIQLVVDRSVLALVPAYNEEERVASVVTGAKVFLPVVVVDDGSSDATANRAASAGAEVLPQPENRGKGAALRAGFRYALDKGYQAVITLDADNQHDPAEIPAFLRTFTSGGADLIIGERNFHEMPFPRNISNTVGRWLFSWVLGQSIPDNQSGYRLLSARMMAATLDSAEHGFEFEVEMLVTCIQHRYKLVWIPIQTIYRGETSHINPISQVVNFLRLMWKTWLATR